MHVIGTAGHVDHGKSTLVEKLTGIDPDRFAEEKRRGLTIDLGFAWLTLPSGNEIGIIDVPGHERFIKNMLAGAGGVSVSLFVVAANEGWKPQSAEHLAVLDVLGVERGIVALTKSDTVDADELRAVRADVSERLSRSSLAGAPVVPCSAVTGAGIDELLHALDGIVSAAPPAPDLNRPRLWVDRVFTVAGAGTVVTGTLGGGRIEIGEEVEVLPDGRAARVRTIQSHKKQVEAIEPGNRTALNLVGLDRHGAQRGDAIVRNGQWRPTRLVDAKITVLSEAIAGVAHELREKGAHLAYFGTAETPVRLRLLDKQRVAAGESTYAQLVLRDPLPLARGDRFVLRDAGRVLTFGGGEILDPLPSPARRGDAERIGLLSRLDGATPEEAVVELANAYDVLTLVEARLRTGTDAIPEGVVELAGHLYSDRAADATRDRLTQTLATFHNASPLERGMTIEQARAEVNLETAVFAALLERTPGIVRDGSFLRLEKHSVALSPELEAGRKSAFAAIEANGFNPPLTKELSIDPALLRALQQSGELVRVGDFHLTRGQAEQVRSFVRSAIEKDGPITVAQIRDLLQTSRKYAVPLCEWLDETGATLRRGDERVLGPKA